jgi:hypothetical protein
MARNRKNRGGVSSYAALSFSIASVRLRSLSGIFNLASAEFGTGGRPWPVKCVPISFERETHHDCWTGIDATIQLRRFAGGAATLTASVLPDDTCGVWSKRPNEEASSVILVTLMSLMPFGIIIPATEAPRLVRYSTKHQLNLVNDTSRHP